MGLKTRESSVSGWALVVDVSLCINCRNCVLATKDEYTGMLAQLHEEMAPLEAQEKALAAEVQGQRPSDGCRASTDLRLTSYLHATMFDSVRSVFGITPTSVKASRRPGSPLPSSA